MCKRCECDKCKGEGVRIYNGDRIPCLFCSSPSVTVVFEMETTATGIQARRAVAHEISASITEAAEQIKSAYNF